MQSITNSRTSVRLGDDARAKWVFIKCILHEKYNTRARKGLRLWLANAYRYGEWSKVGRKYVLFNDALNTFYLRLYVFGHGKGPFREGNLFPPLHGLLLAAKVLLYAHTTAFVTPVVEH